MLLLKRSAVIPAAPRPVAMAGAGAVDCWLSVSARSGPSGRFWNNSMEVGETGSSGNRTDSESDCVPYHERTYPTKE